jgi:hypothetical protein
MATATTREWLRGAVAAVPTPFHDDFSVDLDSLRENIEIMIQRGVRTGDGVLLVAGAGGEFPTLTHDEELAGFHLGPPRRPAFRPTPTLMAELAELFERAELPRVGAGVTA